MRVEQQPAFVLHARPYRETSLLLEVFARDHGRVGLVARGVRREKSRFPRGVLQPLQALALDWSQRGELGALHQAEPIGPPMRFVGEALLAAMYVNEVVLRLVGRHDEHSDAFAAYAACVARLGDGHAPAWTLRRFERDFLADLGYGFVLEHSADGAPVDPAEVYAYVPESGAVRAQAAHPGWPRVRGRALLALARDECPCVEDLVDLRRLARMSLRHVAGGDLRAWSLVRPASACGS